MARPLSPCIGVCRFSRPGPAGRHCIACSMTKAQRRLGKAARSGKAARGFLALVVAQQRDMGRYGHWAGPWAERCRKRGGTPPGFASGPKGP